MVVAAGSSVVAASLYVTMAAYLGALFRFSRSGLFTERSAPAAIACFCFGGGVGCFAIKHFTHQLFATRVDHDQGILFFLEICGYEKPFYNWGALPWVWPCMGNKTFGAISLALSAESVVDAAEVAADCTNEANKRAAHRRIRAAENAAAR